MSDELQTGPVTRLSRRTLRERSAQIDAERQGPDGDYEIQVAEVATAPAAVVPQPAAVEPQPEGAPSQPVVTQSEVPAEPSLSFAPQVVADPVVSSPGDFETQPNAAVSRVVRRSAAQMTPRRTQPPTPAVYAPAAPVVIGEPAAVAPVTVSNSAAAPEAVPFAPVASVVAEPVNSLGVPPWEAITTGARPGGEPVHYANPNSAVVTSSGRDAGRVPPPSAGYTWAQYLILLAVAFVLGLLLWQLIIGEISLPHGVSIGIGLVGYPSRACKNALEGFRL